MSIADVFLPRFEFCESHESRVNAPPSAVLDAVEALDDGDDAIVRALLVLRELPSRLLGAVGVSGSLKHEKRFGMANFTKLARNDSELVYGLVGRFWRPSFGLVDIAAAPDFLDFDRAGVAKLTMSFEASAEDGDATRLITQTRVHCPDRGALLAFAPYWLLIRGASGLVRRRMLAAIRRKAEATIAQEVLAPGPRPD